ncbi:MAG: right-handed parallel beta-helix repeat-containing protein [Chloroflexi bacterium]|nr:right-handed parallel beta-helix repeat-containing protein [Chloroflexota bacterium]
MRRPTWITRSVVCSFILLSLLWMLFVLTDGLSTGSRSGITLAAPATLSATCTVTSTLDGGPGTLRQCLSVAQTGDTITFDPAVFPPTSPVTIVLTAPLPEVTQGSLTIDASDAGVVLDGSATPTSTAGLRLLSSGNAVRGLQIVRFPGDGVQISGGAQRNTIGGDRTVGVGPTGQGNLITRNGGNGVSIMGAGTMSNTVAGNLIGLDRDGTPDIRVQAMAISPAFAGDQTLFLGTRFHGVWKTTDGGSTWAAVRSGLVVSNVLSLAVSPNYATDQTLFAGTARGDVFKSTDGGAGWTMVGSDFIASVSSLALSPNYAGDRTVFAGTAIGVYVSFDGGTTWEGRKNGLTNLTVNALAISPNYGVDQTVFVGTDKARVFKSVDRGSTWMQVSGSWAQRSVLALAISPGYAGDGTLFAAASWGDPGCSTLFKSTDGGGSWQPVGGSPAWCVIRALAVSPTYAADQTLFVGDEWSGFYRSTDGGTTWARTLSGHQDWAIGVSPSFASDRTVFVGSRVDGVFKSVDGASTWQHLSSLTERGNSENGVVIRDGAQGNVVGGSQPGARNVISNNGRDGVSISGSDTVSNTVIGNYVGTDVTGAGTLGNGMSGVEMVDSAHGNVIGGATAGERNVISANGHRGVELGDLTTDNVVIGNYIGTDATGTVALRDNGYSGVWIRNGAQRNRIGGTLPGERNVISGNDGTGVAVESASRNNIVSGNFIGTDALGLAALWNRGDGVSLYGAAENDVANNLISGNRGAGVSISDSTSFGNTIAGNSIGTNVSGTLPISNTREGVTIRNGANKNRIGPGNAIAYNGWKGVSVSQGDSLRNTITANSIYSNTDLGIDTIDGGNSNLAPPRILKADLPGGVVGGTACVSCTVEVFSDAAEEGRVYEGSTVATAAGVFVLQKGAPLAGPKVTATATDTAGNTSEFGGLAPRPLRIFVYDDYEEDGYSGSLREYLEARGHSVTYSHDGVGDVDVWARFGEYDAILAIHTTGGGTLTNLQTWFQNGRGYVAMLGSNMWNDGNDSYIRTLLGVSNDGNVGEGWTPGELAWADPGHPIAHTPNDNWPITGIPAGQNQYYVGILGGQTVVAGTGGAVVQTRDGLEGAGRIVVVGTNYHGGDRTDPEARALVENALVWAANARPAAWFQPSFRSQVAFPGTVVSYPFRLVNRSGQETTYQLSADGNAWPTSFVDSAGNAIASVGPLLDGGWADLTVRVQIPPTATVGAADLATVRGTAAHDPAIVAAAQVQTFAPGPPHRVDLAALPYQVGSGGTAVVTATVTDRSGVPVVDGTVVALAGSPATGGAAGTVGPTSVTTLRGVATTTFTAGSACALAEIQAQAGDARGWAYVSVAASGPTEIPGGSIATHTTWTACAGPYLVRGDLTVNPGVVLTIEPGTQVRFDGGSGLFVQGTLNAQGRADAHVLFTANSAGPTPGAWKGIVFGDQANSATGRLEYATVSYAGQKHGKLGGEYSAGVLVYRGAPQIRQSLIQRNAGYGVWAARDSLPVIADNTIWHNDGGILMGSAYLAAGDVPIPAGEQADVWWRYRAFSAPGPGWQSDLAFDDSTWSLGLTPIGDGGQKTYLELEGGTMYARKVITPTAPPTTAYYLRVSRDDMATVWVNGVAVFTDTRGGGSQWTPYIPVTLAPGPNLIAVEMQDSGKGGNYLDLELAGGSLQQAAISGNSLRGNGNGKSDWPGIRIADSSPLVARNEIRNNDADGLLVEGYSWPMIRNNRIHHNGNGIRFGLSSRGGGPFVSNNTLDGNRGYGIWWERDGTVEPTIENNVVTGNNKGGIACKSARYSVLRYNDAWGNPSDYSGCPAGAGNISRDPLYADAARGDYHLRPGSPAADAGNPDPAFDDVNGTRNDMGAYGGPWSFALRAVFPNQMPANQTQWVRITGQGFAAGAIVRLAETETVLSESHWESESVLSVRVPAGLGWHLYTLAVTNPNGESAELPGAFTIRQPPAPDQVRVDALTVSNLSDVSFVLSWATNYPVRGQVRYGITNTNGLTQTLGLVGDTWGPEYYGLTHHVVVGGVDPASGGPSDIHNLIPSTTYWYELLLDGYPAPYATGTVRTPPTLAVRTSDGRWGRVSATGGQPLGNVLVYLTLKREDRSEQSSLLSARTDQEGRWYIDLGRARTADLATPFIYTSTDRLRLRAEAPPWGRGGRTVTAGEAPPIDLVVYPISTRTFHFGPGWNLIALPLLPLDENQPPTVSAIAQAVNAGGETRLMQVYRYESGQWFGTVVSGTEVVDDFALRPGEGYFLRFTSWAEWSLAGREHAGPVSVTLQAAWNLLGVPYPRDLQAADVVAAAGMLSGTVRPRIAEVDRWVYGGYEGHVAGYGLNNFRVEETRGYFIRADEPFVWVPRD